MQRLMDLGEAADESQTVTVGMVVSVKEITTKQGKSILSSNGKIRSSAARSCSSLRCGSEAAA